MVRFFSILVFGVTGWTALTPASAWSQPPRPATPSPSQILDREIIQVPPHPAPGAAVPAQAESLADLLGPAIPKLESAELAGMAAGTKPAVLTLEQAYSLTLIRARIPAARPPIGPVDTFDPKALDEQARRSGAGDYVRFRREFLTSGFRDPAPGFLTALRHLQAVDSTRQQVAFAESMARLYQELIQGEAAGLSRLQVDQCVDYVQRSRQELADALTGYRSAVDELKVSLGLPPGTPVVLDRRILDPFTTAFIAIDAWQRDSKRQLTQLAVMHDRLPRLEDLKIGGRSLLEVIQGTLSEEPFLLNCIAAARTHRPILGDDHFASDDRNALELRIRLSIRDLIRVHKNYELERRRLELALREVDQRFEQIVTPSAGGTHALAQSANAAVQTTGVIEAQTRLHRGRMRFVAMWLQFKERGLALYRELGTMPYDDWEAFHRSFLPEAGRPAPEAGRPGGEGEPPRPSAPRSDPLSPPLPAPPKPERSEKTG
jgi:hypothetical protein